MSEVHTVQFISTDTMVRKQNNLYLKHEGVKGRSGKPGAGLWYRHGKLTPAGYEHYYGERVKSFGNITQNTYNSARSAIMRTKKVANNPKQAVKNMLRSSKTPEGTVAQRKARKEKVKKIMIAAGAVALTAATAYGIHRFNKTSENITQLARNSISKRYDDAIKNNTGAKQRELILMKQKEMANVVFRKDAYKELGLHRRSQARQFIRDNKIYKKKLVDLVRERHNFDNIKGYRKSKLTGKMRSLNTRELMRAYKETAKNLKDI